MLWGYANGWFPEYLTRDEDKLYAKLKFLLAYGLKETGIELDEFLTLDDAGRDRLGQFLADNDLHLTPYVWYDYVGSSPDDAGRAEDRIGEALREYTPLLRNWSIFTKPGCGHRFDRTVPVEEKLARMSKALAPIAAAGKELGTPLGINNQGDFYISDFVELCEMTPGLYIHLDTSNIFWAGERIFPAFEQAAPYIVGTHWRDERIVIGSRKPRGVLLESCATGDGDVPLRECMAILLEKAPDPERLVMEIEMFRPRGSDSVECLERSLAFIRSLPGVEL